MSKHQSLPILFFFGCKMLLRKIEEKLLYFLLQATITNITNIHHYVHMTTGTDVVKKNFEFMQIPMLSCMNLGSEALAFGEKNCPFGGKTSPKRKIWTKLA